MTTDPPPIPPDAAPAADGATSPPVAPATAASAPAAEPPFRRPSLTRRAIVGVALLIPAVLFWWIVPARLLGDATDLGLSSGVSGYWLAVGGIVLSILGVVCYVVRPTRAYGPASIAASAASVVYLWLLVPLSHVTIGFGSGTSASLEYGTILELLAIVPAIGLAVGVVILVEDLRHPDERLRVEFGG